MHECHSHAHAAHTHTDKKFYLSDASSQLYRPLAYYLAKVRMAA